jgi:monoamine oxidase
MTDARKGNRCEVLEARDRPGGRCWTVRGGTRETDLDGVPQTAQFADGHYMNAGPARIPQHHTTLDYCRELGVAIEPFANANADAYYYNETAPGFAGQLTDRRLRRRVARRTTSATSASCSPRRSTSTRSMPASARQIKRCCSSS